MISAVLMDIEGTTTPVDFVTQILFPYARRRLSGFLRERRDGAVELLRKEHAQELARGETPPPWEEDAEAVAAFVGWLMDRDRKSTGLKALQGRIWEDGYRRGELRSVVYDDVPPALARWRRQGVAAAVYSSGSVLAQKLLFAHTASGDLMGAIDAWFDTTTGPKQDAASYARIAAELRRNPPDLLFLSDSVAELDAARSAGVATRLCVRPGNAPADPGPHAVIRSFEEVVGE